MTRTANELKENDELTIEGKTFRVLTVNNNSVFVAKVLKSGKLANVSPSNCGTYTFDQIDYYANIGAMKI